MSEYALFAQRRQDLANRLDQSGGGVAIIPNAPEFLRNADTHFPYRSDSSFHYLTGFDEPQSWLVLFASGRSVLFCREKNQEREIWDGIRVGPQAAPEVFSVDEAFPIAQLQELMPQCLAGQPAVWFPFAREGLASQIEGWLSVVRARSRLGIECPVVMRDVGTQVSEMRLIKDDIEIKTMRHAAGISAAAHVRAMRFCAERFRGGAAALAEYEIEAELLHEFRRAGAQGPAYPSIVAAGANACILHYSAGKAALRPGELCLIDAGCEWDGYASDITRTFPATGKFSGPQRALYDIVLAAQKAAQETTRPGARQRDAHHAAVRVLSQGLLDTKLLKQSLVGDVDAVIETAAYRPFYMHGTGHWLGRDVHDVGNYLAADEPALEQPDGFGGKVLKKPSRVLQAGMVVTLEPGLYVRPSSDVAEEFWNIGIRIEDDAVVTPTGCELISRGVPVEADEIEALMRA